MKPSEQVSDGLIAIELRDLVDLLRKRPSVFYTMGTAASHTNRKPTLGNYQAKNNAAFLLTYLLFQQRLQGFKTLVLIWPSF